jgi:SAM-dependent methyltransferase
MGEPDRWQRRVEEFVLAQIGDPAARVLEVGCGEGELALALARVGHSVTAIDPRAPEGPIFRRARIEEFTDPGQFDHVVASLALHHVEDLRMALDNIANLLRMGGTLVVVEFAWDRIDEATGSGLFSAFRPPPRQRSLRGWGAAAGDGRVGAKERATTTGTTRRHTSPSGLAKKACTTPGRCGPNSNAAS